MQKKPDDIIHSKKNHFHILKKSNFNILISFAFFSSLCFENLMLVVFVFVFVFIIAILPLYASFFSRSNKEVHSKGSNLP